MTFATYALQVDGRQLPPVRAVVERGRALVAIRVLAESLTAAVRYDPATRTVVVRRASRTQRLPVGRIVAGHAYAPLRAVADALGVDVTYDAASRRIALSGVTRVASDFERSVVQPTPGAAATAIAQPVAVHVLSPAAGSSVDTNYPTITAQLLAPGAPVDPASVLLSLDGAPLAASFVGDVVTATPRNAIAPGSHTLSLTGSDRSGGHFSATWSFSESSSVSQRYAPTVPALAQVFLDHYPSAGDRTFDVIAYGANGANGFVTIDGVPGSFALFPTSGYQYVSHVLLPQGINQPYARVHVYLNPAMAAPIEYTLPTVFSLQTSPATAAPAGNTIDGGPRRALRVPAAAPTRTPAATPASTATPIVIRRATQPSPRPKASASPRSSVPS